MHDIFVGNLSYFCEELDLYNLFNQYVDVLNVRIMRNNDRSRSLMFAFVTIGTHQEVAGITTLLNGHLFMGRKIK